MPLLAASFSIAAPDALSRLTIMRTLTPSLSMLSAIVFIVAALPWAFWMSHWSLAVAQSARSASGSEVTQRCEDLVSGRMMPTLALLPLSAPLDEAGADAEEPLDVPPAGADEPVDFLPLELHAVRASTAAPSTAIEAVVLRMRRSRLSAREVPNLFGGAP